MAVKRWNGTTWVTYAGAETSYGFEATDARVGRKTWVGANTPSNPSDGDIWIDGDTTTNSVAASAYDAKGDLLVGTGPDTFTRQEVGLNGQILVADSAQADGLKWDYAGSRQGLVNIVPTSVTVGSGSSSVAANGAVTFSGASSITIDGCFTSNYQNYKYVIDAIGSANQACQFRFRNSGGDVTGGFYGGGHYVTYTGTSGLVNANNASAIDVGAFGTNGGNVSSDIHNPFSTTGSTSILGQHWYPVAAYTMAWGYAITPNNFTGFRINPASGTLSGTIRIYGYNNGA